MRLKVKRVLFDRKIKLLKDTIFLINSIHILEHKSLKTGLLKKKNDTGGAKKVSRFI